VRLASVRFSGLAAGAIVGAAACAGLLGTRTGQPPSPLDASVLRANQAPIAGLPDVLESDTILGKRVRILGWCVYAPGLLAGQRTGAWFLGTPDTTVEVRGLVPPACAPAILRQALVLVFAQVVRAKPGSRQRLLLRLPD
jgi:hypothetical protein